MSSTDSFLREEDAESSHDRENSLHPWFVPLALSFAALSVILVIRNKRRGRH